jgi:hypothetical protein
MTYDHWKTTNPADAELGPAPESEPCPYCGGDESKCDYDLVTDRCSQITSVDAPPPDLRDALEADGEKLRALTGEDHGPHFCEDFTE